MITEKKSIDRNIEKNVAYMKELLGVGVSFDIIYREFHLGNKRIATFGINGMTYDNRCTEITFPVTERNTYFGGRTPKLVRP